jgi:DHA1 family bicyclomycin/chloramphenicol resistance-like MFS transporter
VLTDMFGWRSVFGFALIAGATIALTAWLVLYETHPAPNRTPSDVGVMQSYMALFRRARFNAFVLQSGFTTGAFMVMASASASLMTELLHRPATEFGLYFALFPIGFFTGNFISSRVGNRIAGETMVLIGSLLGMATVAAQAVVLWHGALTPLAFFIPGFFITMSQGIAMPYAQAGAMNEIPRFAGTAAGVGVFMQNFGAALFSQLYGLLADGTAMPMSMIALLCAALGLVVGAMPFALARRRPVTPP